ncbi:hypothetical protein EV659_101441 [Rhodothalassium salexigens DSM 2132]|uniref:Uncharacterized protein n=1 Tax=Rhodothalassium salexigens DSM 2132 TaxID=1188247 RepID=A0A4V2SQH5_RHOSA|nr:hypothetical protein [Rhodothalassium salexigens DSM 2132]TCP38536.1 hypothetical protein EV659_101441 [Rhodothalassium salexigens DSM 2132]
MARAPRTVAVIALGGLGRAPAAHGLGVGWMASRRLP